MTPKPALILIVFAHLFGVGLSQAQSSNVIGSWTVDITFTNGESRSLRFEARESGKGSFLLLDPQVKFWGPGKPLEATWTLGKGSAVTFSGAVEFPLGNVGRNPGTLLFKGKFETESLITGEVDFSPLVGDQPAKHGAFKAVRAGGE